MFAQVQSYKPALETYNTVDADVITFESSSSGGIDLEAIGKTITEKKIAIGVIDHHVLQVEIPDEVAAKIREALKYIPAELAAERIESLPISIFPEGRVGPREFANQQEQQQQSFKS